MSEGYHGDEKDRHPQPAAVPGSRSDAHSADESDSDAGVPAPEPRVDEASAPEATEPGAPAPVPAGEGDDGRPPEGGSPRRRRLRRRLLGCLALPVLLAGCIVLWLWATYPDIAALADNAPESTAFIDAAAKDGRVAWTWVAGSRISPQLRKAVVAAEDMSFFSHDGFDHYEIEVAIREALDGGRVRGASTITQQLAKNLWLSPSRNPLRKVREALYTRSLERHLSKRRILDIYVNVVEFGPGVYGAQAAARHFFGKSAAALGADEAAQLAAALPSSRWYPGASSRGYQSHVRRVRARMREAPWLDQLVR